MPGAICPIDTGIIIKIFFVSAAKGLLEVNKLTKEIELTRFVRFLYNQETKFIFK